MDGTQGQGVAPSVAAELEDALPLLAGFTPRQRRRLAFLRWLYWRGRLMP